MKKGIVNILTKNCTWLATNVSFQKLVTLHKISTEIAKIKISNLSSLRGVRYLQEINLLINCPIQKS